MKTLQRFICFVLCSMLLMTPQLSAWAQDGFDFSDGDKGGDKGGDAGGGDGFDFSDGDKGGDKGGDAGGGDGFDFADPNAKDPNAKDPDSTFADDGKPLVLSLFFPVDGTKESHLSLLSGALNEHVEKMVNGKEELIFGALDGTAVLSLLQAEEDGGSGCVSDPTCITNMAKDFGAKKVVIGNIYTEGNDRPKISLLVYDVDSGAIDNVFEFESSSKNPKRQQKELWPAIHKALDIPLPEAKTAKPGDLCESQDDCNRPAGDLRCAAVPDDTGATQEMCVVYEKPFLTTTQLIAVISVGAAGLIFIGAGAGLGIAASDLDTEVSDGIKNISITQVDAQKKLDDAASKALIANIMYGLGGAAIATSIVLLFIRPGEETEAAGARGDGSADLDFYFEPQVGAESAGFIGGFRF